MQVDDPRSTSSSPIVGQTPPASPGPARPEVARPHDGASPAGQPSAAERSARGREVQQAFEAANDAPDVRADRVADARQRIAQGTYTVNAEVIARGIFEAVRRHA